MGLADIVASAASGSGSDIVSAVDFIEAPWGLNQRLFPVQRVIIKAHYGIPLDKVSKTVEVTNWRRENSRMYSEADYLKFVYDEGRCNIREVLADEELRMMVLSLGRRSGKTQMSAAIGAYETYKLLRRGAPQAYYGLLPLERIGITGVATDKDQASIFFSKAAAYFKDCPFFAAYAASDTKSYMTFQTLTDIDRTGRWNKSSNQNAQASIHLSFKPCRAKGLRGPGNLVVVLDEFAHFPEDREDLERQDSDKKIYEAVTPSLATFSQKDPHDTTKPIGPVEGRVIEISSPLGQRGLFYQHFQEAFSGNLASRGMFALQAPTWEVNPTIPASYLIEEYTKKKGGFWIEFGAQFASKALTWIEEPAALMNCVDIAKVEAVQASARRSHFVGLDIGLVNDATACAITHLEGDKVVLDTVCEIRAGVGKYRDKERLDFDEVADWIADLNRRFHFGEGLADQNLAVPLIQALQKRGITCIEGRMITKPEASQHFKNFKDMMYGQKLVLYDKPKALNEAGEPKEHAAYVHELLSLQQTIKSKSVMWVQAPKIDGATDDRSDALVRSVWLASQAASQNRHISTPKSQSEGGSRAISQAIERDRVSRLRRFGDPATRKLPQRGGRWGR